MKNSYDVVLDVARKLEDSIEVEAILSSTHGADQTSIVLASEYSDLEVADVAQIFVGMCRLNHGVAVSAVNSETADYLGGKTVITFEIASPTDVLTDELMLESAAIDSEDEDYLEDEDEEDEVEEVEEDDEDGPANRRKAAPGSLSVLTTAEHHKMASRLFGQLSSGGDMSRYPKFLIDFDAFLSQYGGLNAKTSTEKEVASAMLELATLFDVDTNEELAGKKKKKAKGGFKEGRSGLLSAWMKLISGDVGESIVKAWDSRNADELSKLLGSAIEKMAKTVREAKETAGVPLNDGEPTRDIWYANRKLAPDSAKTLAAWLRDTAGITKSLEPNEMHVTLVYSPTEFNIEEARSRFNRPIASANAGLRFGRLGPNKALVLHIPEGGELHDALVTEFNALKSMGATSDYPDYKAHITVSYWEDDSTDARVNELMYTGPLTFGPLETETFAAPEQGKSDPTKFNSVDLTTLDIDSDA